MKKNFDTDNSEEINVPKFVPWSIGGGILFVIFLVLFFSCRFTVQTYERGIVTRNGAVEYIAQPGAHYKLPFFDSVVYKDLRTQQIIADKLNSYTIDNQEVDATIVVQYAIPESELQYVYQNVGDPTPLLTNMIVDRWKIEAGKINVSDIANDRGSITKQLTVAVKENAQRLYHVNVSDVQIFNIDYQDSYRQAQAQAAVVKTQIEQAQGLKTKAQIDADRAKIEASGVANQQIEKARGDAESTRLNAIATAESIRIKGEAEAHAQELMAAALTANPTLIQLEQAKRWNGQLPTQMIPGATLPFMNLGNK